MGRVTNRDEALPVAARTGTRLVHVFSEFMREGETLRRHRVAEGTWRREYNTQDWLSCPVLECMLSRNSRTALGDARSLPFIRDLVEFGTSKARPTDIIVLTNDDTFFCSGLTYLILNRVPWCGAAFAFRWDFKRLARLDRPEIREGRKNMGADLFAFTGKWWLDHGNEYPDMLLGCETWDWIMRELIRLRGGVELFECIFHEKHSAFWAMHRLENVGNRHNRALACAWLHEHSLPCSIGSYSILNTE